MTGPAILEVTITHNLPDQKEVQELFEKRLIAIDWGREWNWKSTDPESYKGRAKTDLRLFHAMKRDGAAVIAAHKTAVPKRSDRIIGWVEAGTEFVMLNGLLCLQLTNARVVSSATSFLGNLAPRGCTVQPCHDRAKGRLANLIRGIPIERGVWSLHHYDVEWLVTNHLIRSGLCLTVWSGGRSFESIDHAGYGTTGREVLVQTTVSASVIADKANALLSLGNANRDLMMFGPEAGRWRCPSGIMYHAIEDVFAAIDATTEGRWLIDRMLSCGAV
ncbi:MAG: hypothetical protein H7Y88_03865 [Phycisphaerales bacterium]|nr:hypothetical protein [Phycisphaerales bacterium]